MTRTDKLLHEDGSINIANASTAAHRARRQAVVAGFLLVRAALRRVVATVGLASATR